MGLRYKSAGTLVCLSVVALLLCCLGVQAGAAAMKLEAQLLWGTDDAKSPNPKHRPVDPALSEKLKNIPLRWKNYFEVNRKLFEVPQRETRSVALSEACDVEVKNVDGSNIQVTHFGKGRKVGTRTQSMAKGELFILGGEAPGATAWLVVLKRVE